MTSFEKSLWCGIKKVFGFAREFCGGQHCGIYRKVRPDDYKNMAVADDSVEHTFGSDVALTEMACADFGVLF